MDVHMKDLKRLVQLARGVDNFHISTISFLMGVDILWAIYLDRPLRFAIQNFRNLIVHYETDELRPQQDKLITFDDNEPWMLAQRYLLP
ncbi:hypothetical protein BBP40_002612 [Aspergillus hancockii]|nr:hypothetical protein BBP40_002612 [Aspergillus hancockii]